MYSPKEDSYFLSEVLEEYFGNYDNEKKIKIKILDMGSGSGIQAETAIENGVKRKNILAADIDKNSLDYIKSRKNVKTIHSDLFEKINEKFDLVVFNPPYLPIDSYDKGIDTTGGEKGDEVIVRFLKDLKNYLNEDGRALLLLSSLTPRYKINKVMGKQGLEKNKIAEKYLFFEKLEIWEIKFTY